MDGASFNITNETSGWVTLFVTSVILLERIIHWLYIWRTSKCNVSLCSCFRAAVDLETDASEVSKQINSLIEPSEKEIKDTIGGNNNKKFKKQKATSPIDIPTKEINIEN